MIDYTRLLTTELLLLSKKSAASKNFKASVIMKNVSVYNRVADSDPLRWVFLKVLHYLKRDLAKVLSRLYFFTDTLIFTFSVMLLSPSGRN